MDSNNDANISNRGDDASGPKEVTGLKGNLQSNLKILEQLSMQTDQNSTAKQQKKELSPRKTILAKGYTSTIPEDQNSIGFVSASKIKSDKGLINSMGSREYLKVEEDPDIVELREKKEMDIKKKEEEDKHKNPVEKQKKENAKNEKKKEKEIDGKKITFDSEGKQLNIKPIAIEKLPIDFIFISPSIGDIKEIDSAKNTLLPLKVKGGKGIPDNKAKTFASSNTKSTKLYANPIQEIIVVGGKQANTVKDKNDKNQDSKQNFQPCGSNFE